MASPTDDVVMPYQVGFPFWSRSVNSGSGDRRFRVSPPADNDCAFNCTEYENNIAISRVRRVH